MLVMGREVGEVITIGDNIRIKVMAVEGGVVRFGISAPRQVAVHRAEIHKRIKDQALEQEPASGHSA
ncbi:carbon storage regulator CsrA [Pseudomonas sp. K1(2024)]|uniref:Translational regulator CsrA n=2 Tax=Pseudomonas TaxID=286 RepID=A0AAI8PC36_9PSED|nr:MULTISPECIES: carbon storage regulator CsrA [Pseudomonas]AIZ33633.1 carbon storage regulator [Pseudomonas parafulva]AXO89309.1 carbon storage regulator [Pseudomonas parafulva]MDO7901361.1 carbon storage regulator CsrA [Pseudomonas sp. K13]MDV9033897.1 carbon storage regulator CsrA [Pseudomonas sp. RAC1]